MDLFTRFYLERAGRTEFVIRVRRRNPTLGRDESVRIFTGFSIDFHPAETVRDHSFRIVNIPIRGVGVHVIGLYRVRSKGWKVGRKVLTAETHFLVEK
ncbi:MAG: hypothetical protein ACRC7O_05195 [Fimbriiglobus sp.]